MIVVARTAAQAWGGSLNSEGKTDVSQRERYQWEGRRREWWDGRSKRGFRGGGKEEWTLLHYCSVIGGHWAMC